MKKITALILVLALAVPVQAWHLFPVREKIVTVKENDWLFKIGIIFASLTVCFLASEIDKALEKKRIIVKPMKPTKDDEWNQQMHYETIILDALNEEFNSAGLTIQFNHCDDDDTKLDVSLSYEDSDSGETKYVRPACLQAMAAEAQRFDRENPEAPMEEQITNREEFFRQFDAKKPPKQTNTEDVDANPLKTSDDGE